MWFRIVILNGWVWTQKLVIDATLVDCGAPLQQSSVKKNLLSTLKMTSGTNVQYYNFIVMKIKITLKTVGIHLSNFSDLPFTFPASEMASMSVVI